MAHRSIFQNLPKRADWIDNDTGLRAALGYVRTAPTLKLCDAIAQTAKHHTRDRGTDPITATVEEVFSDKPGNRVDITWTSNNSGSGTGDALDLANRCVAEWQTFFQQNSLDPES